MFRVFKGFERDICSKYVHLVYKYPGDYTKSRALIGSLSSDYQPIITSTNKIADSCWCAFDEINFFVFYNAFSLRFWNNHLCIYTKTIIRLRLSDYW